MNFLRWGKWQQFHSYHVAVQWNGQKPPFQYHVAVQVGYLLYHVAVRSL